MAVESTDIVIKLLQYKKNINIDKDYMVPIMEHYGDSSEVSIMLNHDFTERYYEIRYFGPMDILTICGGYNASIGPMLGLLSPIFVLNFLY